MKGLGASAYKVQGFWVEILAGSFHGSELGYESLL